MEQLKRRNRDLADVATGGDTKSQAAWSGLAEDELALNPDTPTVAAPGSMEKVMMLQARYAAGVPLWDKRDSSDHGPRQPAKALSAAALNESDNWSVGSLEI
ncbi:MAG: hypothetical protein CMJ65_13755 [Planctomycetaceae bacterium]|jgi:hypothetical protein|nr:hypothetical protein [Planctomycetaceae bacterium]MDP7274562.1 hypothetical protein [Planctomycetaceae bacterium]